MGVRRDVLDLLPSDSHDRSPCMEERLPRKLAAILYADVAGYSRLTGEDEDGTHRALRASLDLIASMIREHSGRSRTHLGLGRRQLKN